MLSLGLHYDGQGKGVFGGLRLAPGSLLVCASMEQLGAWEVIAVRKMHPGTSQEYVFASKGTQGKGIHRSLSTAEEPWMCHIFQEL